MHHRRERSAKTLGLNQVGSEQSGLEEDTPTQTVGNTKRSAESQASVEPQELVQQERKSTSARLLNSIAQATTEKGVELTGAGPQQHQDPLLDTGEQRKRTKIEPAKTVKEPAEVTKATVSDKKRERKNNQGSYCGDNMTPNSLLLLQNPNYIEQQQQRDTSNYSETSSHGQQERGNDTESGQPRVVADVQCGRGLASDKQNDNRLQVHCIEPVSTSSASPMLSNINQFKSLNSVGNLSNNGDIGTNQIANPSANIVGPSDYLSNRDSHQIHSHLTDAEVQAANGINNLQQGYHHSPTVCDQKVTGVQFAHHGAQSARYSNAEYNASFQSSMIERQFKLEAKTNSRGGLEEDDLTLTSRNNTQAGQLGANTLTNAQDLVQQQHTRASANHYYNTHYNLMPTPSSKSSSPTSSNSTPSPKNNAMHSNTSHHSNQLIASASSNASTSHIHPLDHLNNQYVNTGALINPNLQQHQLNQSYSYHHQATGGSNQHQMALVTQDQVYSHQQQQHHLQHHQQQQQQQQHQQQQQQQQHQQQQHPIHQQQHQQQQQSAQNHQSIYHHLANNAANMNVSHIYNNTGSGHSYHTHLQGVSGQHSGNLMSGASQNHLNSAAAACAAVVSQTLKTVANQQSQQHHYGGSIANGFGANSGNLINMTAQHGHFHHAMAPINQHHHIPTHNSSIQSQQQQSVPMHHAASIVTRKYQCKMCPQVS